MAITVDYSSYPYLITIPNSDLTLVKGAGNTSYYADLLGVSNTAPSTPDSVTNSFTGDFDLRVKVEYSSTLPTAVYLMSKTGGGGDIGWYFQNSEANGRLRIYVSADGFSTRLADSISAMPIVANEPLWVRVTYKDSTNVANFYTADGELLAPSGGDWVQLGSADIALSPAGSGVFDSSGDVQIGGIHSVTGTCKIYEAYAYSDLTETTLAVEFNAADNPNSNTTHVSPNVGETWNWNGTNSMLGSTGEGARYQITVNYLWELLRSYDDNALGGVPYPKTYRRIPATASTPAITEINDPTYLAQFENGNYSVEIVNGNSNWRDVEVKNNVSVGTNNTTGFINPVFLEDGLFNGEVCIDYNNGYVGTSYTSSGAIIGTRSAPAKYIADAVVIAVNRNLNRLKFLSSYTIDTGDTLDGYEIAGDKIDAVTLTVNSDSVFQNCTITHCTVTGSLDNNNILRECLVGTLTYVTGYLEYCEVIGDITIGGVSTSFNILNCWSGIAGGGENAYPHIIMGGSGSNQDLIVRGWRGGLEINNGTDGNVSLDFDSGRLHLESDVTVGTYYVRGVCDVTSTVTGTAAVYDYTLSGKMRDLYLSAYHKRVHDKIANTITIYDTDNLTPLYVFNADDDLTTITPAFTPDKT